MSESFQSERLSSEDPPVALIGDGRGAGARKWTRRGGEGEADDDNGEGEVSIMLNVLHRRRTLITVVALAIAVASVALIWCLPVRYNASAAILLDTRPTKIVDIPAATARQLLGGPQADIGVVHSEMAVLSSPRLAETVIRKLDLMESPDFWERSSRYDPTNGAAAKGPGLGGDSWINEIRAGISHWVQQATAFISRSLGRTEVRVEPSQLEAATEQFLRQLSVTSDPRSYVIRVSYESRNPVLAATIANALVDAYLGEQLAEKQQAVKRANIWLNDRILQLREKIDQSEAALERFREANGLAEFRGTTISAQQVSEFNAQLIAAKGERMQKEAELQQIEALRATSGPEAASHALAGPVIAYLHEREADLVRRKAELGARLGPEHPQMKDVEAQLRDVQNRVQDTVNNSIKALASDVRGARDREARLRQQLALLQTADAGISEKRVQARELEREVEANRLLFENLLSRAKEMDVDLLQADARIVARATAPAIPSFPKKRLLVVLALIGSGLIGVTVGFCRDGLDQTFRSTRQLERATMRPCLGLSPRFDRSGAADAMMLRRNTSVYTDAMRSIRVALGSHWQVPRVVLVTSAIPEEGKSVFALSLARSAARAGHRTLLIDCDLRNPSVGRLLRQAPGVDLVTCCQYGSARDPSLGKNTPVDPLSGMCFIPTAGYDQGPQDLLGSRTMREFIDRMRSEYELIVLDTSPLLAATDALVLSHVADTTLLLVRWGATPRTVTLHALQMLARENVAIAGTVLSQVDLRRYRLYGRSERGFFFARYSKYYERRAKA